MDPNVDDGLLWRRRQRWSSVFDLLIFLHAVLICLLVVRLVQLYYNDKMGFEIVVGFGMYYFIYYFIPLLMFTGALTLGCWTMKRHYDKEWKNRGHTG